MRPRHSSRALSRIALAALTALSLAACARPGGGPEGGPPDPAPPKLVRITPDSGATSTRPKAVVFRFDEVVSERPAGQSTLAQLFVISPRDGNVQVDWRRDAITVRPRRGWRPNTTYTVSMLPGLSDLRNNVRKEGASAVFSTGATIPGTAVRGIAFDWAAGTAPAKGYAQATIVGDTSLVWIAPLATDGRFELRALPPGRFVVRAFIDANNNSAFDPRESFDSAVVSLVDSARLELLTFVHDTIGPRIESVTPSDSVTLRVKLDQPMLPSVALTPALFALRRPDSTTVTIAAVEAATRYDSLRDSRAAARTDSLGRANPDSVRRVDPRYAARRDSASALRVDSLRRRAAGDTARVDTAATPRMSRARPVSEVVITLATPLAPSTLYRLQARATGLLGRERTSDRAFRTAAPPKPPAPAAPATTPRAAGGRPATALPGRPVPNVPAVRPDSTRPPATP